MNRIYRRIWNHAKGCWEVASELTRPCGRKSSRITGAGGLLMVALMLAGGEVHAKTRYYIGCDPFNLGNGEFVSCSPITGRYDDTMFVGYALTNGLNSLGYGAGVNMKGDNTTAFGIGARIDGQNSAAFGFKARTSGVDSVAFGYNASANGGHALAMGANAYTGALGATAVGNDAAATRQNAVALGSGSSAEKENALALGANALSNGVDAVALGSKAMVDTGAGTGGVAIGGGARAGSWGYTGAIAIGGDTRAYIDGVALGYAASASAQGAVALGVRSVATETNTVSVGSASVRRRIVNVADGRVTASSTDAVTGKQLHAMNERVDGMIKQDSAGGIVRIANSNTGTEVSMRNAVLATRKVSGVSDGALTTTSTEAVNGRQLNTTNGNVTRAQTAADVAKADASKALAQVTTVTGLIGQTSSTSSVRLGEKNSGTSLDVRNSANANRKVTGVADATLSTSSTEAVTGKQLNTTNENVAKAQTAADTAKMDAGKALAQAVTLGGLVGQVSATGNVRLGEKNSGTVLDVRNNANANRKVSGVAEAALTASSNEAVSGRQLYSANQAIATTQSGLLDALQRVNKIEADSRYSSFGSPVDDEAARAGRLGVALGDSSEASLSGEGAVALGSYAKALGNNSVALGRAAGVAETASNGFALGARARVEHQNGVAIGAGSYVMSGASDAVALGSGSVANEALTISLGSTSIQRRLVNVGRGTGDADGTTIAQVKEVLSTLGAGAGMDANGNIVAPTYSIQGAKQNTVEDALMALDGAVITAGRRADKVEGQLSSIFQDSPSTRADGMNQIALSGANGMVLTNLADGRVAPGSRDAVTGSQLYAAEQKISQNRNDLEAMRKEREVGEQAMRGLDASGPIDFGGARLTGVSDGDVSVGSRDAVNGAQLNETNANVIAAQSTADVARLESTKALVETSTLSGLVGQVAETGTVRLGERNSGALIDVRNSDGANRRVTGIADASLGAGSNDAVTGGQLFSSNLRILAVERKSMLFDTGREDGAAPARAGQYSVALGNGAVASVTAEGGTAVGAFSGAHAKNSVALGRAATVAESAEAGFALGAGSYVAEKGGMALGTGSVVEAGAQLSVALGQGSVAGENGVVSFGNSDLKRRLVNIANGTANHNAATVGQLRGALSALGGEVDANGNIVGPSFTVQGQSQSTLNGALEALDGAVVSNRSRVNQVESQLRSVFQDTPSVRADGLNQLTLAGTHGMVISNVANGLIAAGSRDAVNGGQLHSMQQQLNGRMDGLEQRIDAPQPQAMAVASVPEPEAPVPQAEGDQQVASAGEGEKPTPQPKSKKEDTPKPQVDTAELEKMLARANEYTDGAISNFERRLDKMDKRFNRMAAMSSAQTAMAMNTAGLATYNRLGAGVGYSEGESAMAVGYQRVLNEKGSATFSLNGAFTNSGERSMGVGVGIGW
ncbi:ESPR-type extended signal peptide-containing protein [Stenotrophomonas maltophilia]|uniref:ESPR-type extended signal peptide-containing protein n=1 Tax=Stenotrophomonas maltophilia TaxID=40324 RepID=UPI000DF7BC26|nr:ESPR-type extended signal peptide-containing protein [Stenotrophomonas maltophilia]EMB2831654.1 YadA-like family protein [Stenotrophomonas maltophilia]MBH1452983.1 YadA-like family protein [Stenotrophomonas maltophilia]MBH1730035.1 YadA-like family protein [Stenotrophomonas maltophilia]MBK5594539.1 YadA-like family protein [Stenotrophomonas maltophilia]MBN5190037.1 YadA-like family protein [Stenotrophomonas maltophilia]